MVAPGSGSVARSVRAALRCCSSGPTALRAATASASPTQARATICAGVLDACRRNWRLGSGVHWRRPKEMHHHTRERLLEGIYACEESREDALAIYLSRVMHLL